MEISTEYCEYTGWLAVDLDQYDGAPDGNNEMGRGCTEQEAIEDLMEQLNEND